MSCACESPHRPPTVALPRDSIAMAHSPADPDSLLWSSPASAPASATRSSTPKSPRTPTAADRSPSLSDREAALRTELEGVRAINDSIEATLATLGRVDKKMEVRWTANNAFVKAPPTLPPSHHLVAPSLAVILFIIPLQYPTNSLLVYLQTVSNTVGNASALLDTWTRILSQTEHSQRLLLDPSWKGGNADLAELEAEAVEKEQAARRKAAEEDQRREELRRRREEEEERARLGVPTSSHRGRGLSRGRVASSRGRGNPRTNYSTEAAGTKTISSGRGTSSSSRASGIGRGRSRGTR